MGWEEEWYPEDINEGVNWITLPLHYFKRGELDRVFFFSLGTKELRGATMPGAALGVVCHDPPKMDLPGGAD